MWDGLALFAMAQLGHRGGFAFNSAKVTVIYHER